MQNGGMDWCYVTETCNSQSSHLSTSYQKKTISHIFISLIVVKTMADVRNFSFLEFSKSELCKYIK